MDSKLITTTSIMVGNGAISKTSFNMPEQRPVEEPLEQEEQLDNHQTLMPHSHGRKHGIDTIEQKQPKVGGMKKADDGNHAHHGHPDPHPVRMRHRKISADPLHKEEDGLIDEWFDLWDKAKAGQCTPIELKRIQEIRGRVGEINASRSSDAEKILGRSSGSLAIAMKALQKAEKGIFAAQESDLTADNGLTNNGLDKEAEYGDPEDDLTEIIPENKGSEDQYDSSESVWQTPSKNKKVNIAEVDDVVRGSPTGKKAPEPKLDTSTSTGRAIETTESGHISMPKEYTGVTKALLALGEFLEEGGPGSGPRPRGGNANDPYYGKGSPNPNAPKRNTGPKGQPVDENEIAGRKPGQRGNFSHAEGLPRVTNPNWDGVSDDWDKVDNQVTKAQLRKAAQVTERVLDFLANEWSKSAPWDDGRFSDPLFYAKYIESATNKMLKKHLRKSSEVENGGPGSGPRPNQNGPSTQGVFDHLGAYGSPAPQEAPAAKPKASPVMSPAERKPFVDAQRQAKENNYQVPKGWKVGTQYAESDPRHPNNWSPDKEPKGLARFNPFKRSLDNMELILKHNLPNSPHWMHQTNGGGWGVKLNPKTKRFIAYQRADGDQTKREAQLEAGQRNEKNKAEKEANDKLDNDFDLDTILAALAPLDPNPLYREPRMNPSHTQPQKQNTNKVLKVKAGV